MLATAAPAAAAASVPTFTKPATDLLTDAAITINYSWFFSRSYSVNLTYDSTVWGVTPAPQSLTVVYSVTAKNGDDIVTLDSNKVAVVPVGAYTSPATSLDRLGIGLWTLTWTIVSITSADMPGQNFVVTGTLPSRSRTVITL